MRPVIGVIPLYDEFKDSYWMVPGYMQVLERCGALPVMLPLTEDRAELDQLADMCDGLLLTGGHDVSPSLYGGTVSDKCGTACVPRDVMEKYLLDRYAEADRPVFGICRGIQFMNAVLGGDLYQDLPSERPDSPIEHHMTAPYDRTAHRVRVYEDTPLAQIIGAGFHGVNSYHHQAVKTLSPLLKPMAEAEDGIIEAVYMPDRKFIMAVQWHPEFSYESNEDSLKIMQAFADAAKH